MFSFISKCFLKDFIYLFLDRGEGREKERVRNINVWLPLVGPQLGTLPAMQACALTGNGTGDPHSIHWATPARAFSTYFLNPHYDFFFAHLLFRSVLFNLHIFVNFLNFFLFLISNFTSLWLENILCMIPTLFILFKFIEAWSMG